MAKEKFTRLEKSTAIISKSKATKWCYVNADNEFRFMGKTFVIDDSVKEYEVHNKYNIVDDYTNESYMEEILVIVNNEDMIEYYNQNYDSIDSRLITVKE